MTLRIQHPVFFQRLACYLVGCVQGRFNLHECARCGQPLFQRSELQGVLSPALRRRLGQLLYSAYHRCPMCRQPIVFSRQKTHAGRCLQSWQNRRPSFE